MFERMPNRYSGDNNNPHMSIYWASWDFDNGRSITISIHPDGKVFGAGYTRNVKGVAGYPLSSLIQLTFEWQELCDLKDNENLWMWGNR